MAIQFPRASAQGLTRTSSLPPFSGLTCCGWAVHDADLNDFEGICGVSLDGDTGVDLLFLNDGVTLDLWDGTGDNNFASSPSAGTAFFWAFTTASGGNAIGYWRSAAQTAFTTVSSATGTSGSPTRVRLGHYAGVPDGSGDTFGLFGGRVWNVKVWDRVLSAAELLIESYYRRVMFPGSINFHWPLDRHTDLNDYSGNGRGATSTGTISTVDGAYGLWVPRCRIFIPAAAAGGGSFKAAWARGSNVVMQPGRA